jgi:hypothetical protein
MLFCQLSALFRARWLPVAQLVTSPGMPQIHAQGSKLNHTTLIHASCQDPIRARFSAKLTVPILCGLIRTGGL